MLNIMRVILLHKNVQY